MRRPAIRAVPEGFLSWDCRFLDGDREVGRLDVAVLRRRATLEVDGRLFRIRREGLMGDILLEGADGREVARAAPLGRRFVVRAGDRTLVLKGARPFARDFVLLHGDRQVGSMAREGLFRRSARVEFPVELPLPIRLFLAFLVILRWRQARAAALGGGS